MSYHYMGKFVKGVKNFVLAKKLNGIFFPDSRCQRTSLTGCTAQTK